MSGKQIGGTLTGEDELVVMAGTVSNTSNTWFEAIPAIIMSCPPLSSLHWSGRTKACVYREGLANESIGGDSRSFQHGDDKAQR